jgi:hypothetical protein
MVCNKAQGGINCAEYRFGLRCRRSEPCCRSNTENVNQNCKGYPEEPKRTELAIRRNRIMGFGVGSLGRQLVHERRVAAFIVAGKEFDR